LTEQTHSETSKEEGEGTVKENSRSSRKKKVSEKGNTYEVFENWAKRGDFPNQPEPHPCNRICKQGETMICRFTFVLELHSSMGKVN